MKIQGQHVMQPGALEVAWDLACATPNVLPVADGRSSSRSEVQTVCCIHLLEALRSFCWLVLKEIYQIDYHWWKYGSGSKPMGSHFGVGAPPILEPILVGIGMFTG